MIKELTVEEFKNEVWDFTESKEMKYKGDSPAIIDFHAVWCGPCKVMDGILKELAIEYDGQINFYKVNVDDCHDIAQTFGIRGIPAFLFIPLNDTPKMNVGALPKATFKESIKKFLNV